MKELTCGDNPQKSRRKMKFAIRRLLASVILTPAVAGLYFVIYASLVGLGANPTATPSEVWTNGLWLGVAVSLWFVISALVKKGK